MSAVKFLNQLPEKEFIKKLLTCCHCHRWAGGILQQRPFNNETELLTAADEIWQDLDEKDYLEAFEAHPRIGDVNTLRKKFANTRGLASNEQHLVNDAVESVIQQLAIENERYFQRFGFIFIVFATGKSASEMLQLLQDRLNRTREQEIKTAALEQQKIYQLRLKNLLESLK